jgi:hypothetical protein
MANFDNLQRTAVNRVNNLFGDSATWNPSEGGPQQTGFVLFKDPTNDMELAGLLNYNPKNILAEYNELDFIGLRDALLRNLNEVMVVKGVSYNCRTPYRKYDGKTNIVVLEEPET